MCADPLMCAPTLYPDNKDIYRLRSAWRAREAEILVLAMRGHDKNMKARRFETLRDTSLCKMLQIDAAAENADDDNAQDENAEEENAADHTACRLLQIDLQRIFRQGIRFLRDNTPAESLCNYGYPKRMIHQILLPLVMKSLWHDDQLHSAEWQVLQQIEYLLNLTLTIDSKNIVQERLNAHKKATSVDAEVADLSEPMNKLQSADDDERHAIAST